MKETALNRPSAARVWHWRLQKLRQQGIVETVWVREQRKELANLYMAMLY